MIPRRLLSLAVVGAVLALAAPAGPARADSGPGPGSTGVPSPATAPGTISGASQATCTPGPCTNPVGASTFTLGAVSNDDGTTSTRQYAVSRPGGLVPSPSNRAPAVLVFYAAGNCGYQGGGRFTQLAAANRFVVVAMEVPCGRAANTWLKRNVDGPLSPAAPNDEPYVAAVVQALETCPAAHAAANQCIDPARVYAAGVSGGGNMTADIMCDAQNSPLVRGYLIDSSSLELFSGAPDCPSTNRSYFVMMALSNFAADEGLYYDMAPSPHLDVPTFADWAAARLGCAGSRVDSAIGAPVASNLTYTYNAPCAYAISGTAVQTLGVLGGGHTWWCQDSDAGASPGACPGMPVPPGLGPGGKPKTNGLYIESDFWTMMAQGVSTAAPAPPLSVATVSLRGPRPGASVHGLLTLSGAVAGTAPVAGVQLVVDGVPLGSPVRPGPGGGFTLQWNTLAASNAPHRINAIVRDSGGHTSYSAGLIVVVVNPLSQAVGAPLEALGDDYAAGLGLSPYLSGTNHASDRCRRSAAAYPYLAAALLRVPARSFGFHACAGAGMGALLSANRANHEPAQLHWLGRGTQVVTVSIGWNDSRVGQALASCTLGRGCAARWAPIVGAALARLAARTGLTRVLGLVARAAPRARVVVMGYPRLFPAVPPRSCATGVRGLALSAAAMAWIDGQIHRLDGVLRAAAQRAHVRYAPLENAFGGHEWCTAAPWVGGALGAARRLRALLASSFMPTAQGQAVLARFLEPLA